VYKELKNAVYTVHTKEDQPTSRRSGQKLGLKTYQTPPEKQPTKLQTALHASTFQVVPMDVDAGEVEDQHPRETSAVPRARRVHTTIGKRESRPNRKRACFKCKHQTHQRWSAKGSRSPKTPECPAPGMSAADAIPNPEKATIETIVNRRPLRPLQKRTEAEKKSLSTSRRFLKGPKLPPWLGS